MGIGGGLLGALFVHLNLRLTAFRRKHIPVSKPALRYLEVLFMALITLIIIFVITTASPCHKLPQTLRDEDDGGPVDNLEYDELTKVEISRDFFPRCLCPEGEYSAYGQLFFVPLATALKVLLHLGEVVNPETGQYAIDAGALVLFFLTMFGLMTVTYGIGAPTGLFVPSLAVGAAYGQLVGLTVAEMTPARIDLHSYAVVGAAASLGGATRMTISITVLVMETTGAMQLIVPLMFAVFASKAVGDLFGPGIYDAHIAVRGAPFLKEHDASGHDFPMGDKLKVVEVMADRLVTIRPVMTVRALLDTLVEHHHGAFPVSAEPQAAPGAVVEIDGIITRNVLLKLLQNRIGFIRDGEGGGGEGVQGASLFETPLEREILLERLQSIPFKPMPAGALAASLSETERDSKLDVTPFMQRHPFTVDAEARLSRAYRLFRTMGLRHMFVTPGPTSVVGLCTRKDVSEEHARLTLGEKAAGVSKERLSRRYDPWPSGGGGGGSGSGGGASTNGNKPDVGMGGAETASGGRASADSGAARHDE